MGAVDDTFDSLRAEIKSLAYDYYGGNKIASDTFCVKVTQTMMHPQVLKQIGEAVFKWEEVELATGRVEPPPPPWAKPQSLDSLRRERIERFRKQAVVQQQKKVKDDRNIQEQTPDEAKEFLPDRAAWLDDFISGFVFPISALADDADTGVSGAAEADTEV